MLQEKRQFKIFNLLLCSLALLPVLSLSMVSISIVLFAIGAIGVFVTNKELRNKEAVRGGIFRALLFSTPFFFYIISLLWTDNIELGLKFIGKTAFMFVFPICIFVFRPFQSPKQVYGFIKAYIVSSVLAAFCIVVYLLFNNGIPLIQKSDYFSSIKLRQIIGNVPIVGEHPIYFSLLLATALIFLYYNRFKNRALNVLCAIVLLVVLFLASSKGVLIGLMFALTLMIFQIRKSISHRFFIAIIFIFSVIGTYFFPPIKARVDEVLNTKNSYPTGDNFNSFNTRVAIYDCSLSIIGDAPFFGYGPGDVQEKLNICYDSFNTKAFNDQIFNTHNQYLDYLASFGLLGFGIILCLLVYFFMLAWKAKSRAYYVFLTLMYVSFLTENILERNTGIVLFTMFNTLLAYDVFLANKTTSIHQNPDNLSIN